MEQVKPKINWNKHNCGGKYVHGDETRHCYQDGDGMNHCYCTHFDAPNGDNPRGDYVLNMSFFTEVKHDEMHLAFKKCGVKAAGVKWDAFCDRLATVNPTFNKYKALVGESAKAKLNK
ncbi:hypothetical protein B484DRAFT_415953, partial [Ochromonadaceae sp. CCMP2298]